ncbi:MAG: gamma-glutamylcyclotransferase [Patescibacteria group bacterium]|nr:gamma-glutamylcyclotransferase [Patescibacteria group bacterium]
MRLNAAEWYFAYGSDMDENQIRERIGEFEVKIHAILSGYQLVFDVINNQINGAGFANIQRCNGSKVEGVAYLLSLNQLEKLDQFENVPKSYRRESTFVYLKNNVLLDHVYVYMGQLSQQAPDLLPTREYLNHLLKGENLLSPKYLDELRQIPTID